MLLIVHGREPAALSQAKRDARASGTALRYRDLDGTVRSAILRQLVDEQGGLCAYCMRRIHLDEEHGAKDSMARIEHYLPQSPRGQVDYNPDMQGVNFSNMLAVCHGNADNPRRAGRKGAMTCDAHRGNEPLTVDPRDRWSVAKVTYKEDGSISSSDERIRHDLQVTLNLNCRELGLAEARKSARQKFECKLFRGKKRIQEAARTRFRERVGEHERSAVQKYYQRERQKLVQERPRPQYVGVMLYELDRLIAQR